MRRKTAFSVLAAAAILSAGMPLVTVNAGTPPNAPEQVGIPKFFLSLQDIPLMPGLEELPAETLSFDKPEGRIIETIALMDARLQRGQVLSYYRTALPQFGWGKSGENSFYRKDESLEISFDKRESGNIVKFMIRPLL
ncbi:MAG: hypothetical protein KDI13_03630 [Alphaproteobacteria bacterium]|nr:hypothetical protein [Alphaproteobacteria bacterium]